MSKTEKAKTPDTGTPSPRPLTGVQAWKVLGALTAKMLRLSASASRKRIGRYLMALRDFRDPPDFVHAPFQSEFHDPS